jgi:hypothetical protein
MYIARVPNRKSKPAILLRRSVREGSKVRTETLANLTAWEPERLAALERVSARPASGQLCGAPLPTAGDQDQGDTGHRQPSGTHRGH